MSFIDPVGRVDVEFAKLMVVLAEAFGARLTEQRIAVYATLLNDLTLAQVEKAIYRCARESETRFLPADPELRLPVVPQLRQYVAPSETDAAMVAWAGLQRAAQEVGSYASLDVDDAAVADAVVLVFGSWAQFCELEEGPALAVKRAEFLAAYKDARRQGAAAGPVRLAGRCQLGDARRVFAGLLTTGGRVLKVKDRPQLASAPDRRKLT